MISPLWAIVSSANLGYNIWPQKSLPELEFSKKSEFHQIKLENETRSVCVGGVESVSLWRRTGLLVVMGFPWLSPGAREKRGDR